MSEAQERDRIYFEAHDGALTYERAPLAQEWPGEEIPSEAVVVVHRINDVSRVRVLQNGLGKRLAAPVLDVDAEEYRKKPLWGSRRKKAA